MFRKISVPKILENYEKLLKIRKKAPQMLLEDPGKLLENELLVFLKDFAKVSKADFSRAPLNDYFQVNEIETGFSILTLDQF